MGGESQELKLVSAEDGFNVFLVCVYVCRDVVNEGVMSEGRGEEGGGEEGGEDDETLFGSDEEDTNSTNEVQ